MTTLIIILEDVQKPQIVLIINYILYIIKYKQNIC